MKYIIWILLTFTFSSINGQTKQSKEYNFYSYPAFHPAFSFKIKTNKNKIEFETTRSLYVADSIAIGGYFKIMDNERVEKISKFLPSGNTFNQEINEATKKMLINNLEQLSECKDYKNLVGNDGVTFYIFEGKNKPCEYWSPNKESKKGKLITEILNSLKTTLEKNSYAQNYIINSKKYIDKDYIEIKNENPLYIKLYALETTNCEKLKNIVDKLPKADEIYIDITEFEDEKDSCFLDELNKKYKNLRWIQNHMFDKFNAIPKNEK